MLIRHAPDKTWFFPEEYEANCPVCELMFTRDSWVPGKGHKHPEDDTLQRVFKESSKGLIPRVSPLGHHGSG